ncbi:hypothetical protein ASPVEDRAFT_175162 [Aspergillus versicolor CBS 583.65]|uniref:Rhodopsin domain-containing protein n=1 Tax=Aspergillus versicolor CBS 583.65 TaxID=1036611 RepID=A0A1L9PWG0_ASPVE|nr:uncharacterized protein ASPVEDRAFT_175162 [Aspergillus versicolor CBS 583.65]OJJ05874.1 hypothetical protein ASPVEDRAFT_175162 [Aspergillus versicolor CBS 583.65]
MASLDYWSTVLVVVPIVGILAANLFFILRLISRHLSQQKLDIGDLFMGLGLLFCYAVSLCTIVAAFSGKGQDVWSLDVRSSTSTRRTLLFWLTQTFWPVSQTFVKLSIIMLLRQLVGRVPRWPALLALLIVFSISWGITAFFGNIFQCSPPRYFWLEPYIRGSCMRGQMTFYMVIGSLSLLEDVILLALPISIVWRLRMGIQQKVQVTGLFCLGGLVCIFSLLRVIAFHNYLTKTAASSGSKEALWTVLELDLAIICSSMVLMRPLLARPCFGWIHWRRNSSSGEIK